MTMTSRKNFHYNIWRMIVLVTMMVFVAYAGVLYILSTRNEYTVKTRESLLHSAEAASFFVTADDANCLSGEDSDLQTTTYQNLESNLISLKKSSSIIRYAYVLRMTDGQIRTMVDSGRPENPDYSDPGSLDPIEESGFISPFQTGEAEMIGPVNKGGVTTFCALAPVFDPDTGEVIAVLGIDYSESGYYKEINKHTQHAIIMVMSGMILILCLYWFYLQNTRLKRMSQSIEERGKLFRTIFEQAPVGIAIMDNLSFVATVNRKYLEILDRTEEELENLRWTDITHPDDLAEDMEKFEQFQRGEVEGYSMEKRYLRSDGSSVWVEMTIVRFENSEKRENQHICILQNIEKRKKTEESLRETERSRAVILSRIPGMAYRCDYSRENTIQFVSEGCLELTGYSKEELTDTHSITFKDLIIPRYQEMVMNEWRRVIELRDPFRAEYELIGKNKEKKWVVDLGQAILDRQGNVEALEGIVVDMTERKQQEAHVQFLSDHDFLTGLFNRQYFDQEKKRLDQKESIPLTFFICDINGVRLMNEAFGHSIGDRVIIDTALFLRSFCDKEAILARTGGNEYSILMPKTSSEKAHEIFKQMQKGLEEYNQKPKIHSFELSLAIGFGTKKKADQKFDEIIKEASDYMYSRKLLNRKSSHSTILSSITATMHERSHETEEHANRLSKLAKRIGVKMSLSQKSLDELEVFAMLHDIGKIGIDDQILNKPGKLSDEEWVIMKKHPEIGHRIAMSATELENIAEYILSHHEHWDGSGYPRGLAGEDIPLLARILSVVDAYDAMTQDRVYRKAMSREAAIGQIRDNAGTQFDPQIAKIFLECLEEDGNGKRLEISGN